MGEMGLEVRRRVGAAEQSRARAWSLGPGDGLPAGGENQLGSAPALPASVFKRLPPSLSVESLRRAPSFPACLPFLPDSARFQWPTLHPQPRCHGCCVPPRPAVSDPQPGAHLHIPLCSPPRGCLPLVSHPRRTPAGRLSRDPGLRTVRASRVSHSGSSGFRPPLPLPVLLACPRRLHLPFSELLPLLARPCVLVYRPSL